MLDRRQHEEGFDLIELARRLANVVRAGTVASVDADNYRLRVRYDTDDDGNPILTAPIPWLVVRAGDDRTWWAPEEGEQVVLLSPSGEITEAFALPALYSDARTPPSTDTDKRVEEHSDGARFEYDRDSHIYRIALPAGSRAEISAGTIVLSGSAETVTIP